MTEVLLRVYDLSRGIATTLAGLEGLWHTGVLVHDIEIFYGGGIVKAQSAVIEREYGMQPRKILKMGTTTRTMQEIDDWIGENHRVFNANNYRLVDHNCNHFSNALVKFLIPEGPGIPTDILEQHRRVPAGLLNLVQSFDAMMNQRGPFQWAADPSPYEAALRALHDESGVDEAAKVAAMELLYKVSADICRHATDPSYREHKVEALKALEIPHGFRALEAQGWKKEGDVYTLKETNIQILGSLKNASKLTRAVIDKAEHPLQAGIEAPAGHSGPALMGSGWGAMWDGVQGLFRSPQMMSSSYPAGAGAAAPGGGASVPPRQLYAKQISTLREMGFMDEDAMLNALVRVSGNINQAIDILTGAR